MLSYSYGSQYCKNDPSPISRVRPQIPMGLGRRFLEFLKFFDPENRRGKQKRKNISVGDQPNRELYISHVNVFVIRCGIRIKLSRYIRDFFPREIN